MQNNTEMYYRRGNQKTWRKTSLHATLQVKIDLPVNKLEYMTVKFPSKPNLPNILEPSKLQLPTDFLEYRLH